MRENAKDIHFVSCIPLRQTAVCIILTTFLAIEKELPSARIYSRAISALSLRVLDSDLLQIPRRDRIADIELDWARSPIRLPPLASSRAMTFRMFMRSAVIGYYMHFFPVTSLPFPPRPLKIKPTST